LPSVIGDLTERQETQARLDGLRWNSFTGRGLPPWEMALCLCSRDAGDFCMPLGSLYPLIEG
jgi:hypothetical protein